MVMVCYPDAGEWMKGMEHVAVRAHPDLPSNWIQTCFWVWERMVQLWFAVALTGIIAYHTVGALQKKAQGSRTCFRRWSGGVKGFPHAVCQGMQMMQSGYTVKRYSEPPKNDNFDPKIAFFNWGFADRSNGTSTRYLLNTIVIILPMATWSVKKTGFTDTNLWFCTKNDDGV